MTGLASVRVFRTLEDSCIVYDPVIKYPIREMPPSKVLAVRNVCKSQVTKFTCSCRLDVLRPIRKLVRLKTNHSSQLVPFLLILNPLMRIHGLKKGEARAAGAAGGQ